MIKIEPLYSGSAGNCYVVYNEDTNILLECGVESDLIINGLWKSRMINVSQLNGCLISHSHSDHCKSIKYVNRFTKVYANQGVYDRSPFKGTILSNNDNFKIGTIRIKTISVNHGKTQNNAFILKDNDNTIFFGTDFAFTESNLSKFKFNTIYIEINYINNMIMEDKNRLEEEENPYLHKLIRQINTHLSLENAIENVLGKWDLSECKEIYAIHISKDYGDTKTIKDVVTRELKIPCYCVCKNGEVI